jgi:hypothetical protein
MRREDVNVQRRNPRKKRWGRSVESSGWNLILILQSEVMQAQLNGEESVGGNLFQRLPSSKTSSSESLERYTPITQPHYHTSNQRVLAQHPAKLHELNTRSPPSTHQPDWFCPVERKKHGSNASIGQMQNLLPTILPKNGLSIRIDIVRIVFDSWLLVPTAPNALDAVDSLIFLILSWIIYCW